MMKLFAAGVLLYTVVVVWPGNQPILAAVSGVMMGLPVGVWLADRIFGDWR